MLGPNNGGNGGNGGPEDLDFIGISEDEAEDQRTNKEYEPEDVSPDTLEDEGFFPDD